MLTGVALAGFFTSCSRSEPASELAPQVGERSQALVTTISTCAELQAMENDLSGDYQLANDIDCAGWDPEGNGKGFRPVGIGGWIYSPFEGHFDGAGHVIENLTINRPLEDSVGLFGLSGPALIERVGLENVSIVGYEAVGAAVGATEQTVVRQVYATGSISGHLAGGVVGFLIAIDELRHGRVRAHGHHVVCERQRPELVHAGNARERRCYVQRCG